MSITGLLVLLCVVGLSYQQCTIKTNTQYTAAGDLVTLYNVASSQACCTACQTFEECTLWTYTKSTHQCVVKSGLSTVVAGSNSDTDSGIYSRTYTRSTSCSVQEANTDYYLPYNLGSAPSTSANDCCAKCSAIVGCNYWTLSSGTCWFKQAKGLPKSSSGVTSGTVIPASVVSTPKKTGKRGLGIYGTESCSDIKKLNNVAWVYNWAEVPGELEECYLQAGIQFIPMIWGKSSNMDILYTNSPYLLTFNEPNFSVQSGMTPQDAVDRWPAITAFAKKYGMKIGSPSASYGGDLMDPIAWLDKFFSLCPTCQVDFINTHQYDCNYYNLYGAITNFYKYNKPVWVTEFACYSGTTSDDVTFINGIVPLFENAAQIQKYSYFGARSAGGSPRDVWNSTQSALQAVGTAYTTPATH